jgi:hypothetical protein
MHTIRSIHEKMVNEQLLFVYRGDISERNSLPLITLLENEMKDDSFGFAGQKRLFMFVLESLQNISKHGDHLHHRGMSLVTYSKTDDGYTITTANILASDHVGDLRKRLEEVNKLDIVETKNLYRKILNSSQFSSKGGAGLGLIEMAAKTGNKLDYDFLPVDNEFSYFILSKTVDSDGIGVHTGNTGKQFRSDQVIQLEKLMAENNIYMIWSGHINSAIGGEVLSLAESKLSDENVDSSLRRRVFAILVEILENVSKYNPGRQTEEKFGMPVATIRLEDGKFVLTTGNLILDSGIEELQRKLDIVNLQDKEGLKELFFTSLSEQSVDTDSTGNMGLIAMARKSGGKLDYRFEKVNMIYSYFMLTVKIE